MPVSLVLTEWSLPDSTTLNVHVEPGSSALTSPLLAAVQAGHVVELCPLERRTVRRRDALTGSVTLVRPGHDIVSSLAVVAVPDGRWDLMVVDGDVHHPLVAPSPSVDEPTVTTSSSVSPIDGSLKEVFPSPSRTLLDVHAAGPLAEVQSIMTPLGTMMLEIALIGSIAPDSVSVELRERRGARRVVPLETSLHPGMPGPARVSAHLSFTALHEALGGDLTSTWNVYVTTRPEALRVGRHTTDVADLRGAHRFRSMPLDLGRPHRLIRPYFTVDRYLAVEVRPDQGLEGPAGRTGGEAS